MSEPLYYAKDGEVRKRSVETHKPDGTTSYTLDFPVAVPHEAVGPQCAGTIAALMNEGTRADEAVRLLENLLKETTEALEIFDHDPNNALSDQPVIKEARAFLEGSK